MTIGSLGLRAARSAYDSERCAGILSRVLLTILAVMLAISLVPVPALAETGRSESVEVSSQNQETTLEKTTSAEAGAESSLGIEDADSGFASEGFSSEVVHGGESVTPDDPALPEVQPTSQLGSVTSETVGPVFAGGSSENDERLAAALEALKNDGFSGYYPNPRYGVDSNLNDMMEAQLAELGFGDVASQIKSADFGAVDPAQTGSIDVSAGDGNGFITYFFLAPDAKTVSYDYSVLRQFTPTYVLTCGDATDFYTPGRSSTLAWDDGHVKDCLAEQVASASVDKSIESGQASESVTSISLPVETGRNGTKIATISWQSSDASIAKIVDGFDSTYKPTSTVSFTHAAIPRSVTLTATYELQVPGYGNAPTTLYQKTYDVCVDKRSNATIEQIRTQLTNALKKARVVDFASGDSIDSEAVANDVQLSIPRSLGIDGKTYKLTYTSSDESAIAINGYRGIITRPLADESARTASITATLTYEGISVQRELGSFTLEPVSSDEINEAILFMDKVSSGYQQALLGNNVSANEVTKDLDTFAEASPGDAGSITWARSYGEKTYLGVVPDELPGYDPMAGQTWRTFRSSDSTVVQDENLLVSRPDYDHSITVDSTLTYEKYASLAAAHPENEQLQSLVKRPVEASFLVKGTKGTVDPYVTATCSIIGIDKDGKQETWAASSPYTLDSGATAADLSEAAFTQVGLVADFDPNGAYGWSLSTITSPYDADLTLGWDEATGKYWQLFVNGKAATVGAGGYTLQAGDSVVWCYSAYGDPGPTDQLAVTCEVIGQDGDGNAQTWAAAASYAMEDGATAADLSQTLFSDAGLTYEAAGEGSGWYLNTITSPYDADLTLGWDEATGKYWQLFVNGESATVGAGGYTLQAGDSVVWCYSAYGESLPDPDEVVVVNPDASRPSYDSSWPGYASGAAGGAVVDSLTPTQSASLSWAYDYREDSSTTSGVSDPLIVNGDVYLVAGSTLRKIDAETGTLEKSVSIGTNIGYFCRPVYSDGVVIVPTDDGSLAAFTADALICVWKTAALSTDGDALNYQALSSLTVGNGCVYAGFTVVGAGGVGRVGTLVCVSIADGSVLWQRTDDSEETDTSAGYYWAGAAVSGDDVLIGDEAGEVRLIDGATGEVTACVSLGAACRSTVIAVPSDTEDAYLVVTVDGTLHRIVREGDALSSGGSVKFADESTSTPAVADGMVFVCGVDEDGYGTLSVIDLSSMAVEHTVRGDKGKAQSAPLVSVQQDGTYVYFTCNGYPGGVYGYRLGDDAAYALYVPDDAYQQYCTASVVSDENGNLYYTNDSGTLFALAGQPGSKVVFESNGGSTVASRSVALGVAVSQPTDPTRTGYSFAGWYTDEACTQAWDFDTPVTGPLTLFAKWVERGTPSEGGEDSPDASGAAAVSGGSTGTVAAAKTPLSQAAAITSVSSTENASQDSKDVFSSKGAQDGSSDSGEAGTSEVVVGQGSVNPWAVGGIGLGVVGLAVATVYVIRSRRRGGEVS